MRSRRRFRGYCPPVSRRPSAASRHCGTCCCDGGCPGEYTTSLADALNAGAVLLVPDRIHDTIDDALCDDATVPVDRGMKKASPSCCGGSVATADSPLPSRQEPHHVAFTASSSLTSSEYVTSLSDPLLTTPPPNAGLRRRRRSSRRLSSLTAASAASVPAPPLVSERFSSDEEDEDAWGTKLDAAAKRAATWVGSAAKANPVCANETVFRGSIGIDHGHSSREELDEEQLPSGIRRRRRRNELLNGSNRSFPPASSLKLERSKPLTRDRSSGSASTPDLDRISVSSDSSTSNRTGGALTDELDLKESTVQVDGKGVVVAPLPTDWLETFTAFRITYLIVHIAIMLADGLQGTHLYVLYEGYGYSVASLYCLGFVSGAFTSPFIGPLVDKIGRKKSAMLYCALEIMINLLEQYPYISGLIMSRAVGGVTTNLLFSVFESWLVTEHRRRGFAEEKLEIILRDSVIVSNLAAIASGYLAHFLASKLGPVGPFEGAVSCTAVALVLVMVMWSENYGTSSSEIAANGGNKKSVWWYMNDAITTILSDSKISRIGLIQGLTEGTLQTFVFLWSPALRQFAKHAPSNVLGMDEYGEPAYGLIFGAFMACGVLGGLAEPTLRKFLTRLNGSDPKSQVVKVEGEGEIRPAVVEFFASTIYVVCAGLLITPYILPEDSPYSFTVSLTAFLIYEFMVGLYMPCEGVIRSIYMPTASMCSLMTMLRIIVNVAVALGVISTNFIPFATAFASVSMLMVISAALQLSLVPFAEWPRSLQWMARKAGIVIPHQ